MHNTFKIAILGSLILLSVCCVSTKKNNLADGSRITISKDVLKDKIKGGWAGQTIGVTYGGLTEFRYKGSMIQDYVPFLWPDGFIKKFFIEGPGLYDDVYMDLTFVDVFDRLGLEAPADSFAQAFAKAEYPLWHANQCGRYNVLHGLKPPQSGFWQNNPHADCIDYQIEADYSGLMSPGMVNTASDISDKIGHIMNYGDGWYGGVYVGSMYSLAFVSNDVEYVVSEGLKTIPDSSNFYKCINDVIKCYKLNPHDWKAAWYEVEKKWSEDIGCPEGVFSPFNIDAKLNAAYVVIGLLYGHGDYTKTLDISARCGADSDCNPATAGGILGTILGYSHIPEMWMKNLREVEDMDFIYTNISLNKVYKMSLDQAMKNIIKNGGTVSDSAVVLIFQQPIAVRFEKSFNNLYPIERKSGRKIDFWATNSLQSLKKNYETEFEGVGFAVEGNVTGDQNKFSDYIAKVELKVDGVLIEKVELPLNIKYRRYEICWKYDLPYGKHKISLEWKNPQQDIDVIVKDMIIYANKPGDKILK